ncbi:hypothetical protein EON65_54540 [archaeon]|nr:MAG: hypothetical protein EON65_54540 [archaeon]
MLLLSTSSVWAFILGRGSDRISYSLLFATSRKKHRQELPRPVNVANIPKRTPALCRILAKDEELEALSNRLDLAGLTYFAANVTLQWHDPHTVQVRGSIEGHLVSNILIEKEIVKSDFSSKILSNIGAANPRSMDEHEEYDEEVDSDGNIDIGEIVTQYFAMELY